MSCKRCFDVFLAMFRLRKMIVQCEDWGEKTRQNKAEVGTKELQAHILCSTAHVIIMKRLETYFSNSHSSDYPNKRQKECSGDTEKTLETKESNSNKTTKKSSYDQEDRTIKVRHFHPEFMMTSMKFNCKKILQIVLSCCNQEGLPQIYSGLVNFHFN